MASQLSSGNLISNRYASAFYDLASESKKIDLVLNDILSIQKCIEENDDLKLLIKSPLIKSKDKLIIFKKILLQLSVDKLTNVFINVISNNKRFAYLQLIISQFLKINAKKRGDILADITSAEELSDKEKNEIKNQLKAILSDKLSLNYKVDKKIIGGLIVKVGSKMIDSSLASKINKLKISMKGA